MVSIVRHTEGTFVKISFFFFLIRCNVDSTIQRYTSDNQTQFRFSMEAFKFIGQNNQVRNGLCG